MDVGELALLLEQGLTDTVTREAMMADLAEHGADPFEDQFFAATAEADRQFWWTKRHGPSQGESLGPVPGDMPGWLPLSASTAVAEFIADKAKTCMHAPDYRRPQPIFAAAWRPGLIVCPQCTHLLHLRKSRVADTTCDACGRVCPSDDEPCSSMVCRLGPLTFLFGVCPDCMPEEGSAFRG